MEYIKKSVVLTFLVNFVGIVLGADWDYTTGSHGPGHWSTDFEECGKNRQSPIDIPRWDKVEQGTDLDAFTFHGYDQTITGTIKNNGHTAQVDLATDLSITGGGLDGVYKAAQFHFHWGSDSSKGSEHLVNNQAYPMELHIVHYAEKYGTIVEAMVKPDGLAVLGFFFQVSTSENAEYSEIVSSLQNAKYSGTNDAVTGFTMKELLPGTHDHYYRYLGSLTTPPCFESVIWSVFLDRIPISSTQLAEFRLLDESMMSNETSHAIVDNFRPTQTLHNRKVTYYTQQSSTKTCENSAQTITFNGSTLFLLFLSTLFLKL